MPSPAWLTSPLQLSGLERLLPCIGILSAHCFFLQLGGPTRRTNIKQECCIDNVARPRILSCIRLYKHGSRLPSLIKHLYCSRIYYINVFFFNFLFGSNNYYYYYSIGPDDFLVLVLISGEIGFMTKDFGRGSLATLGI